MRCFRLGLSRSWTAPYGSISGASPSECPMTRTTAVPLSISRIVSDLMRGNFGLVRQASTERILSLFPQGAGNVH